MTLEVIPDDGFYSVRLHMADRWNAIRIHGAADEIEAMARGVPILIDWARA